VVAFPLAYAVIMPALYLPVMLMLLALVFRGVAFEFRSISRSKTWWNFAFTAGSTVAGFCQGLILAGNDSKAFGSRTVHSPAARSTGGQRRLQCCGGLGVISGYALLGATWLVMKTTGPVADRARGQAKMLLLAVLALMGAVSLWTPLSQPAIAARWFSLPNILYLWPVRW